MIQCFESHWCAIILLFTIPLSLKICFDLFRLLLSGEGMSFWNTDISTWTGFSNSTLDLLNLLFGVYMVYSFILLLVGYPDLGPQVLWCVFTLPSLNLARCWLLTSLAVKESQGRYLSRRFHAQPHFRAWSFTFFKALAAVQVRQVLHDFEQMSNCQFY